MIKTKPRAMVTDEFKDLYSRLVSGALETIYKTLARSNEHYRKTLLRRYKADIARLLPLVNSKDVAGKGFDYDIARLRSLKYYSFEVVRVFSQDYFVGTTHDVITAAYNGSKRIGAYDAGRYQVVIPAHSFVRTAIDNIHMIPLRNPLSKYRHPHHMASNTYRSDDCVVDPLRYCYTEYPVTCWASIGPAVLGMMKAIDIVEVFRILNIFIERYDIHSPLTDISNCSHMVEL